MINLHRSKDWLGWRVLDPGVIVPDATQDDVEQVATPARYPERIAAGAGAATWIGPLILNGPLFAL